MQWIAEIRREIPDFGLRGSLFSDTESEPYYWLLKINVEAGAEQIPCAFTKLLPHSPRAYMQDVWLVMTMRVRTWKLPK
jgi:hypothetical protein